MADFVAVIRKAVDGLADNTSGNRERVYEKARRAVRRQLENMSQRPSEDIIGRQLDKLDSAIEEVELEHVEALPAEDGSLDALSLDTPDDYDEPAGQPLESDASVPEVETRSETVRASDGDHGRRADKPPFLAGGWQDERPADDDPETIPAGEEPGPGVSPFGDEGLAGDSHDEIFGIGAAGGRVAKRRRARRRQLAIGFVALLVVVGAAFGIWSNRKSIAPMIARLTSSSPSDEPASGAGTPETADAGKTDETANTDKAKSQSGTAAEFPANKETSSSDEDGSSASGNAAGRDETAGDLPKGGKYTQRLMADGTETNPGPASQPDEAKSQEGNSVTAQTGEGTALSGADAPGAQDTSAPTATAAGEQAAISQKMYLYEERFKDQKPATVSGSVVWSLAKNTSDDSGGPTKVIHGEISVPDKGITALMTIKPNTDPSLPASHLIELVFALPGDFSGGGIASVERVALKQTEQDRGDALIGVPAKITDNFFMVALNDYSQAATKNVELLKSRNWIDIPITYTNGRRVLITLEKGSSGSQVFDEAFKAWAKEKASSTGAAPGAQSPGGNASDKASGDSGSSDSQTPPDSTGPDGAGQ